jgi:hypothetical protein
MPKLQRSGRLQVMYGRLYPHILSWSGRAAYKSAMVCRPSRYHQMKSYKEAEHGRAAY